jgi:hypothetical protein
MLHSLRAGASLLALAALLGCGEGASTISETNLPSSAPSGIEITGTVAAEAVRPTLLVFALVDTGPGTDTTAEEQPPSVGVVNEQGEFVLTGVAPGTISVIFLDDRASDGVIDDGDPIAVLTHEALRSLQDGTRVTLVNVHLDFRSQKATAERVDAAAADPSAPTAAPAPTATPTP